MEFGVKINLSRLSLLIKCGLSKVLIFLFMLPSAAYADGQWCEGTFDRVWVDYLGNVLAVPSWRSDHVRICSLKGVDGRTDTVTCSMWYTIISESVKTGRGTIVHYDNAPACAQMPTYGSSPIPYYVMLLK